MKKAIAAVVNDVIAWLANSEERQIENYLAKRCLAKPAWMTTDEEVIDGLNETVVKLTQSNARLIEARAALITEVAQLNALRDHAERDAKWWKMEAYDTAARGDLMRRFIPVAKWATFNDEWNALHNAINSRPDTGPVLSDGLRAQLREIGIQAGFTTRAMADGRVDFHEYVYAFATPIMARVAGPGVPDDAIPTVEAQKWPRYFKRIGGFTDPDTQAIRFDQEFDNAVILTTNAWRPAHGSLKLHDATAFVKRGVWMEVTDQVHAGTPIEDCNTEN